MNYDAFSLKSISLPSEIFDDNFESLYIKMGKEKGFALFLQLFRYRVHKGDLNRHIICTSLSQLRKFTNINMSRRIDISIIRDMLINFERLKLIKVLTKSLKLVNNNDFIMLEILLTNISGYYFYLDLNIVDYIYYKNKLTDHVVSVYALLQKFSNNVENKAFISVYKASKILKLSDTRISMAYKELNKIGLIATIVKRRFQGSGIRFEHIVCKQYDHINQFRSVNEKIINKYINRNNK